MRSRRAFLDPAEVESWDNETMKIALGRHVYGLAAVTYGVLALIWHDPKHWQQLVSLGTDSRLQILVYTAAAIQIFGGIAIQWPRTARAGALALGILELIFALLLVPAIAAKPQELYRWLNCFYQLSLFSAALVVYSSRRSESEQATRLARLGCIGFGICLVSFAI